MSSQRQLFNTALIIIGAILLIFDMITKSTNVYIKIIGLVILMYGLFTATRQWVEDNNSEDDGDVE